MLLLHRLSTVVCASKKKKNCHCFQVVSLNHFGYHHYFCILEFINLYIFIFLCKQFCNLFFNL